MDYQKFIQQFPKIYNNWGKTEQSSKLEDFVSLDREFNDRIEADLMTLINLAVSCLEADEIYCQIGGIAQGKSLIGALLNNFEKEGYAVEISDEDEDNMTDLIDNLIGYNLENQVSYSSYSCLEEFWLELQDIDLEKKIGVYFYDFVSDYRSQLLSLLLAKKFWSERALIIIRNSHYGMVQQACFDFLLTHSQGKILLDLSISNGVYLILWDRQQSQTYDYEFLTTELTNKLVIQALSDLHNQFEFTQKPQILKGLLNEARELQLQGQIEAAIQKYQQALEWDKYNSEIYYELGSLYEQGEKFQEATQFLTKAIELNFKIAKYHYSLGVVFFKLGHLEQSIKAYQKSLEIDPSFSYAYNNLGNIFYLQKNWKEAINFYQSGLQYSAKDERIYRHLINSLQNIHRIEEAIKMAEEALQAFPNSILLKMENLKILPLIYESRQEIDLYRERLTYYLDELLKDLHLETLEQKKQGLEAIGSNSYFALHYQGKNDLGIKIKLGSLINQVMAANYPLWVKPLESYPLTLNQKIRIGYLSAWFRNNNSANWSLDWIKNTNREEFEIYCYYPDTIEDEITEEFRTQSDFFYPLPKNIEIISQQILSDKIHILIYPDIGTIPLTTQIAALRLAPIQCTAWGGPVTSGLMTIDYYLSSDLMEPDEAQEHYLEKLIRLPNIGLCYPRPKLRENLKQRDYFNLDENSIIYLCCQNLLKYLPQYDYIFPSICQRVSQAKFLFIESDRGEDITKKLKKRLKSCFKAFDINSEDYCLFIPQLNQEDYLNINLLSDIYLDTFDWSGGNTTMQAIACNLPIVTCPGEFMRGRHSYGMLRMLGVEETIAKNESEYIDIAIRLGLDQQWRTCIKEKMKTNQNKVYHDTTCVKFLEDFFKRVIS